MTTPDMALSRLTVGRWTVPAVVFAAETARVSFPAMGLIGNSITTSSSGKQRTDHWKRLVTTAAKHARQGDALDSNWQYSVSAGFSFNPGAHGGMALDVENFLKPTFDALAAGLFCPIHQDPAQILRYNYDDSNFRYLFVHRLSDAQHPDDAGVAIVVSIWQ